MRHAAISFVLSVWVLGSVGADSITVRGILCDDVYIWKDGAFYQVLDPKDGSSRRYFARSADIGTPEWAKDPEERRAILIRWHEKQKVDAAAQKSGDGPSGVLTPEQKRENALRGNGRVVGSRVVSGFFSEPRPEPSRPRPPTGRLLADEITPEQREEKALQDAERLLGFSTGHERPAEPNELGQSPASATPHVAENGSYYGEISRGTGRPKTVRVRGYYRKDGTYVRGHYRSKPRR